MSEQEMNLASILAIVTNPEMVAKNIQKLQADIISARNALDAVEQAKEQANARHSAAEEIEASAEKRHNDLNIRESNISDMEKHWLDKDTAQKAEEKAFNEEKIQFANRVRDCSIKETENEKRAAALDAREAAIKAMEDHTLQLNNDADQLKKAYEAKIASIKSFATQVVG